MILSIVIPTMHREKLLKLNSDFYKELSMINNIEIVFFVNDFQNDGSYNYLIDKFKKFDNIKIYKQEKFVPFGINLISGIKKSKGKYICLLSDEDIINIDFLKDILQYLSKNNITFASSPLKIKRNNSVIRYRNIKTLKKIKCVKSLKYYYLSMYISGLIFNSKEVKKIINLLNDDLIISNYFLKLYPQTFLFLVLFVRSNNCKSIYFNFEFIEKVFYENSLVEKEYKNDYGALEERYKQLVALTNILDYLVDKKYIDHYQRNMIMYYVNKSILNLITPKNKYIYFIKIFEKVFL